jgi:hypothetical protein
MTRCRAHPRARVIVLKPIDSDPRWMCMLCGKNTGSLNAERASGVLPVVDEERNKKAS